MNTTPHPFIPDFWNNPEIQEINRLPMRSPLPSFSTMEEAVANAAGGPEADCVSVNPRRMTLDGEWDFTLLANPRCEFPLSPGKDAGKIRVPGTWTLQGYDKPHYTNVQMPFNKLPPDTPDENPTGVYYTSFALPESWNGKRVVLHIGSAESAFRAFINGAFIGAGKDTRLPSEFDATAFIQPGENTLCIQVARYSDASYVEDQDQWWFGGLHRSVYLYCTEAQYIADITAMPSAPEKTPGGGSVGRIHLAVAIGGVENAGNAQGNTADQIPGDSFRIDYAVYKLGVAALPVTKQEAARFAKTAAPETTGCVDFECNYRVNSCTAEIDIPVEHPDVWSHEKPVLYIVAVALQKDGAHIESTAFCTGFRSVEIAGRELRINGKMVYIKGVNRHEHNAKNGKTLSTEEMKRDIILLKTHNFNAVRTCHYPDDERWYDLCDRYGIYVTDEANIENHCFYDQLCRDARWAYAYASRVQRMVLRDKNHPSVIIWSLGNESGDGPNQALCGAWVRKADATRPVHYEGFVRPERGQGDYTVESLARGKGLTDIIAPMYPSIDLIVEYARFHDDDRPLIMCEYSHAMGNSNGSLADYWKAIKENKGLQGGYIWDWIDQGIEAEKNGRKYWKYGGDFGDTPSDYDFCLNGILLPDQTPKPVMEECRQVFAPVSAKPDPRDTFLWKVKNEFDFTTLDALELTWTLFNEGAVIDKGALDLPAANPGETVSVRIPGGERLSAELPRMEGLTWLRLEFRMKKSDLCAEAGLTIKTEEHILKEGGAEDFVMNSLAHTETSGDAQDAAEALLEIAGLFTPCLFRAPTENDGLKTYFSFIGDPRAKFYWENKAAVPWIEMDLLHLECTYSDDGKTTETAPSNGGARHTLIRKRGELFAGKNAAPKYAGKRLGRFSFEAATLDSTGNLPANPSGGKICLKCRAVFDLDPSVPELPRVGLQANIPALFTTVEWLGRGFCESYEDRKAGAETGVFSAEIPDLAVPYVVPQTNGNRTDIRGISIKGGNKTVAFRFGKPIQFSASIHTEENLLTALHTCDLEDTRNNGEGFWTLHLDCAHRGVGTAACGPDTLERYRIRPGLYEMEFYLYTK